MVLNWRYDDGSRPTNRQGSDRSWLSRDFLKIQLHLKLLDIPINSTMLYELVGIVRIPIPLRKLY